MEYFFVISLVISGFIFIGFGIYLYQKYYKISGISKGLNLLVSDSIELKNIFLSSLGILNISRGLSMAFIAVARYNIDFLFIIFSDFFKEFISLAFGSIFALILLLILELKRAKTSRIFQNVFTLMIFIIYVIYIIFGIVIISIHFNIENVNIVEEADTFLFAFIYIILGILILIFGSKLISLIQAINSLNNSSPGLLSDLYKKVILLSLFYSL